MLGLNAGPMIASISPSPELLIHLAIAKKLEGFQTTILNAKAKADHAQQVATSAHNAASATANAARTYAQMIAAPPKPSPPPPSARPTGTGTITKAYPRPGPPTAPKSKKAQAASPEPSKPTAIAPPPAYSPAQRRIFAPLRFPQRIPNSSTLLRTLPALLANPLLEKKLPREAAIFTATINDNGTVSLTPPKGYAADYYAPYHDQLAKATQQHIAPENNTYEASRPTDLGLPPINRVPVSALPSDPAILQKAIAGAVHPATGIAVGGARTLLPWERITKETTFLVIHDIGRQGARHPCETGRDLCNFQAVVEDIAEERRECGKARKVWQKERTEENREGYRKKRNALRYSERRSGGDSGAIWARHRAPSGRGFERHRGAASSAIGARCQTPTWALLRPPAWRGSALGRVHF